MVKKARLEKFEQADILTDMRSYEKYIEFWKNIRTSENKKPDIFFTSCLTGPCVIELKKKGEDVQGGQLAQLKKLHSNGTRSFAVIGKDGYIKLKRSLGINEENLRIAHEKHMLNEGEWTKEKYHFE